MRVFGADVAEQLNRGQVVSAFGNVYEGIDVETSPAIEADRAREIIEARAGVEIGRVPELVILPRDGDDLLTWRVRAAAGGDIREYFVDARDGSVAFEFSDLKAQSAVARRFIEDAPGWARSTSAVAPSARRSRPACRGR